jgi:glutathione S-transferase
MRSPSSSQEKLTIYSMAACPYAQRTRILLQVKGINSELVEIDLSKPRPQWFLEINPAGKVPALVHRGRALNETSVINEYLEDCFPDVPLFPKEPYERALSRNLIEYCNGRFTTNLYRLLMEQDGSRRHRIAEAAVQDWQWLDEFLARAGYAGGFLFGRFGMAELSCAPFFQRHWLNTYFWNFRVPPSLARALRWRDAALGHDSVLATSFSRDEYIKLYADYALGFANGAVLPGQARSSLDLSISLSARPLPAPRFNRAANQA